MGCTAVTAMVLMLFGPWHTPNQGGPITAIQLVAEPMTNGDCSVELPESFRSFLPKASGGPLKVCLRQGMAGAGAACTKELISPTT